MISGLEISELLRVRKVDHKQRKMQHTYTHTHTHKERDVRTGRR